MRNVVAAAAEIEPLLLMIRPPRGLCAFITRNASRRTEECAGEVRVDDAPPLLDGEILDRNGRRTNAGVVEQEIESPERAHRLLKELYNGVRISHIGGNDDRSRAPSREASAVSVSGSARRPASLAPSNLSRGRARCPANPGAAVTMASGSPS